LNQTPLFSEVAPGLFIGGTADEATIDQPQPLKGLNSNNQFDCVVTMYAYAAPANWGVEERRFGIPDAELNEATLPIIMELADWAHTKWRSGKKVNIRCQAGWNRSGLVTALTLMLSGMSAADAISTLRTKRSPYALCNQHYETWLLTEASKYINSWKVENAA